MSKSTTLALASTFTLDLIGPDDPSSYYDEAIYALGALPYLLETTLLDVLPGQATFQFPESALTPLELWYDNRTLDYMTHAELDALTPTWRDQLGSPIAYTDTNMSLRTFQLFPRPSVPSTPMTS